MVVKLYFKDGPRILDDHKKARGFIRGLQSYISEKLNGGIRIGTVCYFLDYTLERKALHDLGKLEKNLIEGIKLLYGEISGFFLTFLNHAMLFFLGCSLKN